MAISQNIDDYVQFATNFVSLSVSLHSLKLTQHDRSEMGEWYVTFENSEFILSVSQDRIGYVSIDLGSKVRPKRHAHLRGPWSIAHLRGFIDGINNHYQFEDIKEEGCWLARQ